MSGVRSILRDSVQRGYATPKSTPIRFDSTSNRAMVIPAGSGTTEYPIQDNGPSSGEIVITTKTLLAAESGKTFFLDLAAAFVTTLPAPVLGLRYTFIIKTAVTSNMTVVCPSAGTLLKGHVLTTDVNSATDPDFDTTAVNAITFVANKSVAGDRVDIECDGTNWFYSAKCSVFDAITGS